MPYNKPVAKTCDRCGNIVKFAYKLKKGIFCYKCYRKELIERRKIKYG